MTPSLLRRAARAVAFVPLFALALGTAMCARAADVVNAYSIWPENWTKRPMFEDFERASGIKSELLCAFRRAEALARIVFADKDHPRCRRVVRCPSRGIRCQ